MNYKFSKIYHFIKEFKEKDIINLDPKIDIIYRNYKSKINLEQIKKIKIFCKRNNRKFFLANNINLAYQLNLDGAYIPSFNRSLRHNNFPKKKKFLILGSAHNEIEINIKNKQKCDLLFISPIFQIKKNSQNLKLFNFQKLTKFSNKRTIALGGINETNINQLKLIKVFGFASISYIKKNRPRFL